MANKKLFSHKNANFQLSKLPFEAYNVVSEIIYGPDGRCGYRRGTYCASVLPSMFLGCAAFFTPEPLDTLSAGLAIAWQAKSCFTGYPYLALKCRECMRDTCAVVLRPVRKDHACEAIYQSIEKFFDAAPIVG